MRRTRSRPLCSAGSLLHSMRFRMVSSSFTNSFTSQIAFEISLFHTTSASASASTTMYSTPFAFLCVYTFWCSDARVWNSSYTLYTSEALKQILSSITFMKLIRRLMSTLPLTPVLYASRMMYSNLSTSTELRLLATMSQRNFLSAGASASFEVIRSRTRLTVSASMSMWFSSTIHSNMSALMASWFQAAFFGSQPACRRGKNSLSKTWLNGPCPRSWHKPASWMESLSMCDRFWRTARPLLRRRPSYMFVARWHVPSECSNLLCDEPGKT